MIRNLIAALCALLAYSVTYAQCTGESKEYSRTIGQAKYVYCVDKDGYGANCTFRWSDSLVGTVHLVEASPDTTLTFSSGGQPVVCSFRLSVPGLANEIGCVESNVVVSGNLMYEVLVTAWARPADTSSADSVVYRLAPALYVVTKPIGAAKNNASVTIYSGSLMMFTTTLTQASPFLTHDSELILGDTKINGGMQLTLQIPSVIQLGYILMNATYSTQNIPPTTIHAQVASWKL